MIIKITQMLKNNKIICPLCLLPLLSKNNIMMFECHCSNMIAECLQEGYCFTILIDKMEIKSYVSEAGNHHITFIKNGDEEVKLNNFSVINISKKKLISNLKTFLIL